MFKVVGEPAFHVVGDARVELTRLGLNDINFPISDYFFGHFFVLNAFWMATLTLS